MQSLQYFPRLLAEFHSVNEVGLILYLFSHESLCKLAALKYGIRNPVTETESWKRKRKWKQKRNTESNINDRKLKNFSLHNLVQSKEKLF